MSQRNHFSSDEEFLIANTGRHVSPTDVVQQILFDTDSEDGKPLLQLELPQEVDLVGRSRRTQAPGSIQKSCIGSTIFTGHSQVHPRSGIVVDAFGPSQGRHVDVGFHPPSWTALAEGERPAGGDVENGGLGMTHGSQRASQFWEHRLDPLTTVVHAADTDGGWVCLLNDLPQLHFGPPG